MPRTKVFISYSHEDEKWLKRLQKHLKPLVREGRIDLWDDTRIAKGKKWRKEIQQALKATRVAVLLISADFMASKFIVEEELPLLLEAAETEGVVILPVLLSASRYAKTPSLSQFQAVNSPKNPVVGMKKVDREALFKKVADSVEVALDRLAPGPVEADEGRPTRPWNVPYERNFFFTGRDAILTAVRTELTTRGRTLLSGLGGAGKTQIAVEYAYRHRNDYDAVLWVTAETPETLRTGYADLARALRLPQQHAKEQQKAMEAVTAWLGGHDGWLLILDNADEPESLDPLVLDEQGRLKPFLREAQRHLLITSRADTVCGRRGYHLG